MSFRAKVSLISSEWYLSPCHFERSAAQSINLVAEFEKHKVTSELLVIKGAGHGFRGEDGKRASDALVVWFEKHLLKK